jgi:hypothetical protein
MLIRITLLRIPDLALHLNADPNLALLFNADPDPAFLQSDVSV